MEKGKMQDGIMVGQVDGKYICPKHGEISVLTLNPNAQRNGRGALPICAKCKDLIDRRMCFDCEIHPATIYWGEGPIAIRQGIFVPVCRCCELTRVREKISALENHAKQMQDELTVKLCSAIISNETAPAATKGP
jgi:hypothetical protein